MGTFSGFLSSTGGFRLGMAPTIDLNVKIEKKTFSYTNSIPEVLSYINDLFFFLRIWETINVQNSHLLHNGWLPTLSRTLRTDKTKWINTHQAKEDGE